MRWSQLLALTLVLGSLACAAPVRPSTVTPESLSGLESEAAEALDTLRMRTLRATNMKPLALATRASYPPALRELVALLGQRAELEVVDVTESTTCRTPDCQVFELSVHPEFTFVEIVGVWAPGETGVVMYFRTNDNYHLWAAYFEGPPGAREFRCLGQSVHCGPSGV